MATSHLPVPQTPSETDATGPAGVKTLLPLVESTAENGGSCCGGSCSIG